MAKRKHWTLEELEALPRSRAEAKAVRSKHYFSGEPCEKAGHVAARTVGWHCVECERDFQRQYQEIPARGEYRRAWEKSPKGLARWRAWEKSPKGLASRRAGDSARRASEIKATPPWLTAEHKAEMAAIYAEAVRLMKETGVEYHVDHVVPLKAKCPVSRKRIASGLHLPWNLAPMIGEENIAKNCWLDAEAEAKAHWDWLTERGLTCDSPKAIAA